MPQDQKQWLSAFANRMIEQITKPLGLRPEFFLQLKVVEGELKKQFLGLALEVKPILGLARRPGASLPAPLTPEDVQAIAEGKRKFDFKQAVPDYCYWFLKKDHKRLQEVFSGYGGATTIFTAPDPAAAPPKFPISDTLRKKNAALRMFDIDELMASTFAMRDAFLPKSKELFGAGLESEPSFKGIPFILPLLMSSDFFNQPAEEVLKSFQLFDFYISESPADKGVLLAAKNDIEQQLAEIIAGMNADNLEYPERNRR